jgi:hypothetical protein
MTERGRQRIRPEVPARLGWVVAVGVAAPEASESDGREDAGSEGAPDDRAGR